MRAILLILLALFAFAGMAIADTNSASGNVTLSIAKWCYVDIVKSTLDMGHVYASDFGDYVEKSASSAIDARANYPATLRVPNQIVLTDSYAHTVNVSCDVEIWELAPGGSSYVQHATEGGSYNTVLLKTGAVYDHDGVKPNLLIWTRINDLWSVDHVAGRYEGTVTAEIIP